MCRSRGVLAVVLLVLAAAASCTGTSGANDATAPSSTAATTPSTIVTPSTASTTGPTDSVDTTDTTAAPAPVATFPSPSAAGEALFGAWKRGDRQAAGALLVAPPAELDKLFLAPARGAEAKNRGCDDGAFGTASCFFANGQGGVNVALSPVGGGWQITTIDPFG